MLKKDSWGLGILIGLVVPLLIYGLILLILSPWGYVERGIYQLNPEMPFLVAIFFNLLPFRYFMVSLKYDKTGRGILLITFLMAIAFFYFK